MKITSLDVFRFNLPFVKALFLKRRAFQKRQGLILRLTTANGLEGLGEISPLPGFSQESLEEAQNQVLWLKSRILNQTIPPHGGQFSESLERWLGPYNLYPSVRFGIEGAVLNLLAQRKGIAFHRLLGASGETPIPLIGLLEGSLEAVTKETRRLFQKGVRTFKLKVGRGNVSEDLRRIEQIKKLVGPGTLRLDANQSWSFKEALNFARLLPQDGIEYIEEPFKNPSSAKIRDFFQTTGIPVAWDESLMKMSPRDLKAVPGLKAIILKPTLLGGMEEALCFIRKARTLGITPIVSSSFESGVGLLTLAHLALANGCYAGLDTLKWFEEDLVCPGKRIRLEEGCLTISPEPLKKKDLNWKLLEGIS